MFKIPSIRISGSTNPQSKPEARRGTFFPRGVTTTPPRNPIPTKQRRRKGLGVKVSEYALSNPDKTVRQVAEHFDTSTAYVRRTEVRRGFECARVNKKKQRRDLIAADLEVSEI